MQPEDFIKIEQIVDDRIERHLGIMREFLNDQFTLLYEGQQSMIEATNRGFEDHKAEIIQNKTNIDHNSLDIVDHEKRIKILERSNKQKYA